MSITAVYVANDFVTNDSLGGHWVWTLDWQSLPTLIYERG
jgi:hypothetical protein